MLQLLSRQHSRPQRRPIYRHTSHTSSTLCVTHAACASCYRGVHKQYERMQTIPSQLRRRLRWKQHWKHWLLQWTQLLKLWKLPAKLSQFTVTTNRWMIHCHAARYHAAHYHSTHLHSAYCPLNTVTLLTVVILITVNLYNSTRRPYPDSWLRFQPPPAPPTGNPLPPQEPQQAPGSLVSVRFLLGSRHAG